MKPTVIIGLFYLTFAAAVFGGYTANVWKLAHLDFAAPYKAEALRGIGVVVPPLGVIEGYLSISDKG